jgi:hypothetical protein
MTPGGHHLGRECRQRKQPNVDSCVPPTFRRAQQRKATKNTEKLITNELRRKTGEYSVMESLSKDRSGRLVQMFPKGLMG